MKLKLIFIVLIVSYLSAIVNSTTNSTNSTSNVTAKPRLTTTTPPPNFIVNTLDSIRKFFFSEFFIVRVTERRFSTIKSVLRLKLFEPIRA